jgi:hypothetical protein
MEGGVAFLHTRAKDKGKIARPFVVCGRSWEGIQFGAPDGRNTYPVLLAGPEVRQAPPADPRPPGARAAQPADDRQAARAVVARQAARACSCKRRRERAHRHAARAPPSPASSSPGSTRRCGCARSGASARRRRPRSRRRRRPRRSRAPRKKVLSASARPAPPCEDAADDQADGMFVIVDGGGDRRLRWLAEGQRNGRRARPAPAPTSAPSCARRIAADGPRPMAAR